MSDASQVLLRPAAAVEAPFIFRNWLDSYFPEQRARLKKTVYYEGQHALIERLLKRSRALVACNTHDPDQLYGFAVGELFGAPFPNVFALHYVYVKQAFRERGIGSRLVRELRGNAEMTFHSHEIERGSGEAVAAWSAFRASLGGSNFNPYSGCVS